MTRTGCTILALTTSGFMACGSGGGRTAPAQGAPSPTPVSGGPFDLLFTGLAVPHAGQRLFVLVIRDADGAVLESGSQTIGADGAFSLSWSGILAANASYHLDFFADYNGNEVCDPPRSITPGGSPWGPSWAR